MPTSLLEKLLFVETQCVNPQDALVIRLLIEGFEIHEIVYLKTDSLDKDTRTITFKDASGNKKQRIVSDRCAKLITAAASQTQYMAGNGQPLSKNFKVNLKESRYVIKVSIQDYVANESMIKDMDSVVLRTIYNRLRSLADMYQVPEITYVTTVRLDRNHLLYA